MCAYDDPAGWGREFVKVARQLGYRARLFHWAWQVPNRPGTVVFLRMRNSPLGKRDACKRLAEALAAKSQILMIPTPEECRLYDDKRRQAGRFAGWLPPTWILESPAAAEAVLAQMAYPFISKSSEGASSSNVRLIGDVAMARAEIAAAFSPQGLKRFNDGWQKGYLLWQKFMPDNPHDWRVVVIGYRYVFCVRRLNRAEVPFASGSHHAEPILELDETVRRLFDFALDFAKAQRLSLAAMDIVRSPEGGLVVLENSSCWERRANDRPFFIKENGDWRASGLYNGQLFHVIIQAYEEGCFDPAIEREQP
jgi:glutathione synthase/RimK-type ligase-like ATP-grasp enzyme